MLFPFCFLDFEKCERENALLKIKSNSALRCFNKMKEKKYKQKEICRISNKRRWKNLLI